MSAPGGSGHICHNLTHCTIGSIAEAHLRMGNLDLAIMDFTKAIELDPRMSSSFYGRSVIERKRGDEVRALARGHIWPR